MFLFYLFFITGTCMAIGDIYKSRMCMIVIIVKSSMSCYFATINDSESIPGYSVLFYRRQAQNNLFENMFRRRNSV